jgi:hypothetical protein
MEQYTAVTTAISIHLPFIKILANIHPEQSVNQITAYSEQEFHTRCQLLIKSQVQQVLQKKKTMNTVNE